jgi:hypothetical protein
MANIIESVNIFNLKEQRINLSFFKDNIFLPISIFNNNSLSALEAISKYLKEELDLRYCEIALLLNRNERTIWGAYNSAKQQMNKRFVLDSSDFLIPIYIFRNRSLGVLEVLAKYLKEELNLRYCQIASLLNRDDRTIWTVYNRVRKKRNKIKNDEFK